MMDFEYLCAQYELGQFQSAAPLKPGTVAQVWRLETSLGRFLVRTLNDQQQGEREWAIHRHLLKNRFDQIPALILTAEEEPCLYVEGQWMQVQGYVGGVMPNPAAPGMAAALADTARRLERCMPEGIVHGDLGPWNMLLCEDGRLVVIDFGAARPGDPYFDYAALFGGVINHTDPGQRPAVCGEFVRVLSCDRTRLLEQLRLWAEEGVRAWTGKSEKMVSRFINALHWAEENLYDI